jgi:xeroderma pigmentosum group C-complementing protein
VADDIVQPYHLPKRQYAHIQSDPGTPATPFETNDVDGEEPDEEEENRMSEVAMMTYDLEMLEDDRNSGDVVDGSIPADTPIIKVPKTMREMAEDAARNNKNGNFPTVPLVEGEEVQRSLRGRNTPISNGRSTTPRNTRSGSSRKRRKDDSSEHEELSSPTKRGREGNANNAVAPAATTRVLRPRAAKSVTVIQEEKDRENAYRRAVAE